jgi:hypothetical protein
MLPVGRYSALWNGDDGVLGLLLVSLMMMMMMTMVMMMTMMMMYDLTSVVPC